MYWINPQKRLRFHENEFSLLVFQWNRVISVFLIQSYQHSAVSWTLHWTNGNAFLFILLRLKLSHLVNCLISHHIQYIFIRIFNSLLFSTHLMKRKLFHSAFVEVNETCVGYDLTQSIVNTSSRRKTQTYLWRLQCRKKNLFCVFTSNVTFTSVDEKNLHHFSLSKFQFIAISQKLVYSVFHIEQSQ